MNKAEHVINAVLLSIGVGVLLNPEPSIQTVQVIFMIGVPVVIGAVFPDIDTEFGVHRKTFHNIPVLGGFIAFPIIFGNLFFVWIGIATHYVLDLLGSTEGLALLYPYPKTFDIPLGVPVDSRLATLVTLVVTAIEIAIIGLVIQMGYSQILEASGLLEAIVSILPL